MLSFELSILVVMDDAQQTTTNKQLKQHQQQQQRTQTQTHTTIKQVGMESFLISCFLFCILQVG